MGEHLPPSEESVVSSSNNIQHGIKLNLMCDLVPDLTFSEMNFLTKRRDATQHGQADPKESPTKISDADMSRYFDRHVNAKEQAVPPYVENNCEKTQPNNDSRTSVSFPKEFLGFGSAGTTQTSPVRRSLHAVDRLSKERPRYVATPRQSEQITANHRPGSSGTLLTWSPTIASKVEHAPLRIVPSRLLSSPAATFPNAEHSRVSLEGRLHCSRSRYPYVISAADKNQPESPPPKTKQSSQNRRKRFTPSRYLTLDDLHELAKQVAAELRDSKSADSGKSEQRPSLKEVPNQSSVIDGGPGCGPRRSDVEVRQHSQTMEPDIRPSKEYQESRLIGASTQEQFLDTRRQSNVQNFPHRSPVVSLHRRNSSESKRSQFIEDTTKPFSTRQQLAQNTGSGMPASTIRGGVGSTPRPEMLIRDVPELAGFHATFADIRHETRNQDEYSAHEHVDEHYRDNETTDLFTDAPEISQEEPLGRDEDLVTSSVILANPALRAEYDRLDELAMQPSTPRSHPIQPFGPQSDNPADILMTHGPPYTGDAGFVGRHGYDDNTPDLRRPIDMPRNLQRSAIKENNVYQESPNRLHSPWLPRTVTPFTTFSQLPYALPQNATQTFSPLFQTPRRIGILDGGESLRPPSRRGPFGARSGSMLPRPPNSGCAAPVTKFWRPNRLY